MRLRPALSTALLSVSVIVLMGMQGVHAQDSGVKIPTTAAEADAQAAKAENPVNTSETYNELNLFGDVFERVRAQYVDPISDKKLIEYALNGMLSSLDPHSSYMDAEQFKDMQVETRGEFGGLGIEVTMDHGVIKVVSPIDDTPAFRAGVKAGDYITRLDGKPIIGMTLNDAVNKMRGKIGTTIKLTLRREGVPEPIEVTITRDVIKIPSVKEDTLQDKIGYIRIASFSDNTDSGLRDAVAKIKKKLGKNLIGYIVDLRNNPGGLLDQAIAVSDDFLQQGEIVSTRGRHKDDTKRDNATPGDITDGLPIVVLINGGTASAAEIVSGALQDHRRALLMGLQSFGKGSVQTIIPLPGHGAMRLTTARYYTPSGRSIQALGITPDIVVEPAKVESVEVDRIREADLKGALVNPDKPKAKKSNDDESSSDDTPAALRGVDLGGDKKDKKKDNGDARLAKDYQLARAVDVLTGISLYGERHDATPAAKAAAAESSAKPSDEKANDNKKGSEHDSDKSDKKAH